MRLLVASSSVTRKKILDAAQIEHSTVQHSFNERSIDEKNLHPIELVTVLADQKVAHACIPEDITDTVLILGADTVIYHEPNTIFHKPKNLSEAKKTLSVLRTKPIVVSTGLSLGLYQREQKKITKIGQTTSTTIVHLELSDQDVCEYIEKNSHLCLQVAGGLLLEDFGARYVRSIEGSYTGALGLPLFELQKLLRDAHTSLSR